MLNKKSKDSIIKKIQNVEKHLRIARATKDKVLRDIHIDKAGKLISKYGFDKDNEKA